MTVQSYPVRWTGQHAVVTLPDEIDVNNAAQAGAALDQALTAGAKVIVADMTATVFCSSDGIRALNGACRAARDAGAQLRLAAPGPAVRRVLELTGLDRLIDVYPSLDAALTGQD